LFEIEPSTASRATLYVLTVALLDPDWGARARTNSRTHPARGYRLAGVIGEETLSRTGPAVGGHRSALQRVVIHLLSI
jgi:hypothetical protein